MTPPIDIFNDKPIIERRIRNAAGWFYWIIGFTAVFTVINIFTSSHYISLFSLAVPIALALAGFKVAAVVCLVISAAIYIPIAIFGSKGARWALILGFVFYLIDTAVMLVFQEWLVAALHAYALFGIYQGIPAAGRLAQINAAEKAQAQGQIGAWYGGAQPAAQQGAPTAWPPPPQAGWQPQTPPAPSGWQSQAPPQQTGWQPQFPPAEQSNQSAAAPPAYSQLSAPEPPAYSQLSTTPVPGDLTAQETPAPSEP